MKSRTVGGCAMILRVLASVTLLGAQEVSWKRFPLVRRYISGHTPERISMVKEKGLSCLGRV